MKLLLTSGGITNPSLQGALAGLLGKPVAESSALELTALPSIDEAHWVPMLRETDALLVGGGDPLYLCHWMQQSGLADLLPSLVDLVYVGVSAGSLVMGPMVGQQFVYGNPLTGGDKALGLVDFSMFPHLDHENMPDHAMEWAERWATGLSGPAYAMDDQTAIKVAHGSVEVISEGQWRFFAPAVSR